MLQKANSSLPPLPEMIETGLTRRQAVATAAAALASAGFSRSAEAAPLRSLRTRAAEKGLFVGAALETPLLRHDPLLAQALAADCNILVPENGFNWTRTQARRDSPLDFGQVQPVWELARANEAKMRLHGLVYDLTTPQWVRDLVPTLSAGQAGDFLEGYIRQVLDAWGSRVIHIEVVNEPGYKVGPPYRPFVFADKLGEEYIDLAFHVARDAAAKPMLFTNAAMLEQVGRIYDVYRAGMLGLLDRLLKRGVPVQALGIEGHLRTDYPFDQSVYAKFLEEVTARGLQIMVTEFDVNDLAIAGNVAKRDAEVAAIGKAFLDTSFSFRQCLGVLTWSFVDRHSWLRDKSASDRQRKDAQPLRPGFLDDIYRKKALWHAVAAALDHAPRRAAPALW